MRNAFVFILGLFLLQSCAEESPYQSRTVTADYFPTVLGAEWVYELSYSDRGEFRSLQATGLMTTHLIDIETNSDKKVYTFSAILDCDWVDRGSAPGSGYVTYFHRIDTTTFAIVETDGKLLVETPSPDNSITSFYRKMFHYVNPQRMHSENFDRIELGWGPENRGYGVAMSLSKENGLESFWGDSGGVMFAFKQYTTITLELLSYSRG